MVGAIRSRVGAIGSLVGAMLRAPGAPSGGWRLEDVEDRGPRRLQRGDDERGRIEAALLGGSEDRGKHLLGLGPARGAIAAPAHLAGDHGGPQGMLGAPIGGIERRVDEEAEDGLEFGPQMGGEAAGVGEPAGACREQSVEAVDVVAARDGEALVRHVPEAMAVPRGESRPTSIMKRPTVGFPIAETRAGRPAR